MIVRTKKYKMSVNVYVKLGIKNILYTHWWIFVLLALVVSGTFFIRTIWFVVGAVVLFAGYLLFWMIQFYGLAQLEENRTMFERIMYEITNQYLVIQLNSKQGMPIPWGDMVKAYKEKGYFLLVRSKVQFFCLPFKIFHGDNEIKLFTTLLQRKALLK